MEGGIVLSLSYIAGFFDCAACRLCAVAQTSFGLERGQTGDAAEVLHRPFNVHRSHNEVLRLSYRPARDKEEEEQTSKLRALWIWRSCLKPVPQTMDSLVAVVTRLDGQPVAGKLVEEASFGAEDVT